MVGVEIYRRLKKRSEKFWEPCLGILIDKVTRASLGRYKGIQKELQQQIKLFNPLSIILY